MKSISHISEYMNTLAGVLCYRALTRVMFLSLPLHMHETALYEWASSRSTSSLTTGADRAKKRPVASRHPSEFFLSPATKVYNKKAVISQQSSTIKF